MNAAPAVRIDATSDDVRAIGARTAQRLTAVLLPLAAVASAGGLFLPGLYRETTPVPAMRGQDLVTLVAVFALAATLPAVRRQSSRATLVWIGLLGYMLYAYTGAAFAYRFNQFFLLYLVLFNLSVFALVAAAASVDVTRIKRSFDEAAPRGSVIAFLIALGVILGVSELSQIIPALATDAVPELLVHSEGAGNFVYALDLGLILPLAVIAAVLLRRRSGWGYVLSGALLIKAVTMGLALLSATWFAVRAGMPVEFSLTLAYGAITLSSLGLGTWFFHHCSTNET